jgi:hypothetical protein
VSWEWRHPGRQTFLAVEALGDMGFFYVVLGVKIFFSFFNTSSHPKQTKTERSPKMLYLVVTGPNDKPGPEYYRVVAATQDFQIAYKYRKLIIENEEYNDRPMVPSVIGKYRYQNHRIFVDILTREIKAA